MLSPRRLVRLLPLLLLQALLLPGPSTAFRVLDENQPPTNTTIVLGYNAAKYSFDTQVSPLGSATYRITVYSLQMWLQYLANTTDLLPGATVQLVANPFKDTIAEAIITTLQLLDRGVIGIVGSGISSATKLTTMLTEAKRVPQCDGASTNPDLSDKTKYPYFFRTIPSDNLQTVAIRDFVLSMGWRRVAIISQTDAYGTGILKAFQDAVAGSPLKIISVQNAVSHIGITPDGSYNASSWEAYLDNIRDSNVFVVLVFAIADQVEGLFQAAAKRGMMSSKYVWIGSDGMQSIRFSSRVPGFMITRPVDGNGPAYDFVASLASKYLREINTTEAVSANHFKHAACMELLLRGFDRFLRTTPGTSITDLAAGRLNRLFPSPATMFNFPDVFTPTGKVNLDPLTGDPTSSYNIFSIQGDQKQFVPVAQWDAQTRQVTITRTILYGTDELTVTPADDIVVADYTVIVRLRGGLGASAIALNLIAMLLITATAAFFAVHRHNPIIRKSSIPNMHMMLVGLLLPCFDVFTMVGTPTAMHCIADIWLIGLGFVVVLSALATKLLRLYRVFNGIQITASIRKGLSNIDLLEQTTLSILVAVAILLVWTLVDPPKPTLMRVSSLSYYYTCSSTSTAFQMAMNGGLTAWIALLLLMCTMLAFATQHVRADFNEAKMVGLCVYSQVVIGIVVIPLLSTSAGTLSVGALFTIKQTAILVVVLTTLAAVHGSKINAVLEADSKSRSPVSLPRSRPRPQPLPSAETTDILPVRRAYPSRHPTMANSHAHRVTDKDDSDDLSDTDESSSESQACGSDPNCQRSPTSSLTYKSKRPVLVAFKAPGMASAWTTAQLILIPSLDIVLLKRTRLHVSKTGDERASRRCAQVFFSGPQLFLRDIRQLRMVADGRDERVVNVFARDQLVLSVKFDDVAGAVDFRSLCELTPVEKNSGTARGSQAGPVGTQIDDAAGCGTSSQTGQHVGVYRSVPSTPSNVRLGLEAIAGSSGTLSGVRHAGDPPGIRRSSVISLHEYEQLSHHR